FGWNSCTGLVSRIQVVSERFDDPISRDADMGRALVDHSPDGIHNGASRPNLPAFRIFDRWNNKEMAEQFVCAVDQVNIHPFNYKVDLLQSCFSKHKRHKICGSCASWVHSIKETWKKDIPAYV